MDYLTLNFEEVFCTVTMNFLLLSITPVTCMILSSKSFEIGLLRRADCYILSFHRSTSSTCHR